MKQYIGTKIINAKPMNKDDYNFFRKWELPEDENPLDEGYLVEYLDGGQANTSEYTGYVSWSPKDVFERAYKSSGNLSFGSAIEFMKLGKKVARKGWNGKGMFIFLCHPIEIEYKNEEIDTDIDFAERMPNCIAMMTATSEIQVGWLSSQADMLSEDWEVL